MREDATDGSGREQWNENRRTKKREEEEEEEERRTRAHDLTSESLIKAGLGRSSFIISYPNNPLTDGLEDELTRVLFWT